MRDEVRLSRSEYWLLEAAVVNSVPVSWVIPPNVELALNVETHGLSSDDILGVMLNLARDGKITFEDRGDQPVSPSDVTVADLKADDKFTYRLTVRGGGEWEAFARPKWERFVDEWYLMDDGAVPPEQIEQVVHIECACREVGALYLEALKHNAGGGGGGLTISGCVREWECVEPFKATYWKQLPRGYVAEFACRMPDDKIDAASSFVPDTNFLRRWYRWG